MCVCFVVAGDINSPYSSVVQQINMFISVAMTCSSMIPRMCFHCNNVYVNVPNITLYTQCLFYLAVDLSLGVYESSVCPSFTWDYSTCHCT